MIARVPRSPTENPSFAGEARQKGVTVIVLVEGPPQDLPGRQGPVPLQLSSDRSPVDGHDPWSLILAMALEVSLQTRRKRRSRRTHLARIDRSHGGEGEAWLSQLRRSPCPIKSVLISPLRRKTQRLSSSIIRLGL